jgi:hypothetical protein
MEHVSNDLKFRMFSVSDSQYERYLKRQQIQAEKLKETIEDENNNVNK